MLDSEIKRIVNDSEFRSVTNDVNKLLSYIEPYDIATVLMRCYVNCDIELNCMMKFVSLLSNIK